MRKFEAFLGEYKCESLFEIQLQSRNILVCICFMEVFHMVRAYLNEGILSGVRVVLEQPKAVHLTSSAGLFDPVLAHVTDGSAKFGSHVGKCSHPFSKEFL